MTHAEAKKIFAEIMKGLRQGLHLSPEGKRIFEDAKAKLRQYRKPVMRNRKLTRTSAKRMLHLGEYSSERQRRFLGARASGYPARRNPGGLKDINGGAVYDITYQKRGPHRCDAECKRFRHMYRHSFTSHPKIYGDGEGLRIRS